MTTTPPPAALQTLWATPLGLHRHPDAEELNGWLARVLASLRATDPHADPDAAFYASRDDLLHRIRLPEWQGLVRFIVDSLSQTVAQANQAAWPEARPSLKIALRGLWFQIANRGAHHDVHTHGNCSWSGVYCVQVDPTALRTRHPVLGERNGVTRFYGPYFSRLGGAHMDHGNAYLQAAHVDIAPVPGQLVVFPAWLAHQAMPYAGDADRIILSFNASVHADGGSDELHGYASA